MEWDRLGNRVQYQSWLEYGDEMGRNVVDKETANVESQDDPDVGGQAARRVGLESNCDCCRQINQLQSVDVLVVDRCTRTKTCGHGSRKWIEELG